MSLSGIETELNLDKDAKDLMLASSVLDEGILDSYYVRMSAMETASILITSALDNIQTVCKTKEFTLPVAEVFIQKPVCQVFNMENFKSRR